MALPTASDNIFPKLILAEAGTLGIAAAGERRLGVDANGVLVWKNSAGTTSPLVALNKWDATTAPTANEDSGDGYAVGSRWIDTTNDKEYICLDASVAAAVWTETTQSGGAGISAIPDLFLGSAPEWMPTSNTAVGAANRAVYMKMYVGTARTVTTAYFRVGTQSGNLDIGIYDATLTTKLGSTGSFACPVVGVQSQAFSAGIALSANTIYYVALAASSSTCALYSKTDTNGKGNSGWQQHGYQDTAFPLPTTPSPAGWDVGAWYPVVTVR